MNILATAALVLAAAFATPSQAATEPAGHAVLVVPCAAGNRPTLRAVADLIGDNNSHRVYKARSLLMAQVRSACAKPGITQVALVGRQADQRIASDDAMPASGPIAGN